MALDHADAFRPYPPSALDGASFGARHHLLFYGSFSEPFARTPRNDEEFVVVRKGVEGRYARIVNCYRNPNTGNPTYELEYGDLFTGGDVNDHDWARKIVQGNVFYSLWVQESDY